MCFSQQLDVRNVGEDQFMSVTPTVRTDLLRNKIPKSHRVLHLGDSVTGSHRYLVKSLLVQGKVEQRQRTAD